jgi:hypothetical protein
MRIKIPLPLVHAAHKFESYLNKPVYRRILLVDILIAMGGLLNVAIGWWYDGWWGALQYGLLYLLVCMCSLWFF